MKMQKGNKIERKKPKSTEMNERNINKEKEKRKKITMKKSRQERKPDKRTKGRITTNEKQLRRK